MSVHVSIVIPALNAQDTLKECLESFVNLDYPSGQYEVILVDNGSTDNTLKIAREFGVRVLKEPVKNATRARNRGIKAAKGEIVFNTDSDVIADKQFLKRLLEAFEDPAVGGAGGEIESAPPKTFMQAYAKRTQVLKQAWLFRKGKKTPPILQTANAAYRKKVLDEVGGFDPELFGGGDADLAWRVQFAGYKLKLIPDAKVYHIHRPDFRSFVKQFFKYGYSSPNLFKKHAKRFGMLYYIRTRPYIALVYNLVQAPGALLLGKTKLDKLTPILGVVKWSCVIAGRWWGSIKNGVVCV